jgi:Flp pilus assembly protein TadG
MLRNIREFRAAEEGAALLIFALTLFVVIGSVAFAIDVSRFFAAKSRLSIASEMTVVAAAQNFQFLTTAELNQLAADVMQANFHTAHMLTYSDDAIAAPAVNLVTDGETGEITLTASAEIPTTLLRTLNFFDNVTVESKVSAFQQKPEAEVALVIDSSEVFETAGRLAEITVAANVFIAALEAEATQAQGISWALIPVGNEIVNVAPYDNWVEAGSWPTNIPPDVPGTTEWGGDLAEERWCVAPRAGVAGEDDTPPGTVAFPLVLTLDSQIDAATGLPHYSNITTADCREERIIGLTSSLPISTALASLGGNGGAAYGRSMLWAERILSPLWQGLWNGNASMPAAYEDETTEKIAILVVGSSAADVAEDTRLSSSCARMKQNNITLYVIDYLAPAATTSLLQVCATTAGHYFRVTDMVNLQSAFFSIAKFMTVVRFGS